MRTNRQAGIAGRAAFAGAGALALALAGCGESEEDRAGTPASAADSTAPANAAPENAPGITVADALVRLPAVPGRPGVAYFTIAQAGGTPRRIAGVHVEGAGRAEMHESREQGGVTTMAAVKEVSLQPGTSVEFGPGGHHVMLFDVADTLKAGTTTELTITLDNGDKVSAAAQVEGVGGAGRGDHEGMDHAM